MGMTQARLPSYASFLGELRYSLSLPKREFKSFKEISSALVITWKQTSLKGGWEPSIIRELERDTGMEMLAGIVPEMKGPQK